MLLDKATLMRDFIDSAALLSGTDSLGFWFALRQEFYDGAKAIYTTFIPYREHSRLLGIHSIDEYIRCGGTLRAGELAFDDAEVAVYRYRYLQEHSAFAGLLRCMRPGS